MSTEVSEHIIMSGGLHNASMEEIQNDMKWQNAERQQGIQAVDARQKGAREQEIQEAVARTRKFDTNKQNRLEKKNERRAAAREEASHRDRYRSEA